MTSCDLIVLVELCYESFLGRPLLRIGAWLSIEATDEGALIVPSYVYFLDPSGLPLPLTLVADSTIAVLIELADLISSSISFSLSGFLD